MSDNAIILAARVPADQVEAAAARAVAWLVQEGIVEAMPSDCALGQLGHRPGPRALEAVVAEAAGVVDFRALRTNGFALWYAPRPRLEMSAAEEVPTFSCPHCKSELDGDALFEMLDDLVSPFRPPPEVECAACKKTSPLVDVDVEGGAFANLVFRFWNWWPLSPAVIEKLSAVCGAPLVVLHEHL